MRDRIPRLLAAVAVCFGVAPVLQGVAHAGGPDRVASADMPGGSPATAGLQQGIVTHTVPLELPPAAAGLVPDVALIADPRAPDGWLGPNWMLAGFSRIERHSALGGVPTFDAEPSTSADLFSIDGMRLWDNTTSAASGAPGSAFWSSTVWEPEQQDGRRFDYDEVENVWRARSHGWTWEYGVFEEGGTTIGEWATERRTEGSSIYLACLSWSVGCGSETSAWLLSRVTDPFGNTMELDYAVLPSGDYAVPSGGIVAPTLAASTPVLSDDFAYAHVPVSVRFGGAADEELRLIWDERDDVLADGRSGRLRVLPERLAAIEAWVGTTFYSRYEVEYADEAGAGCAGETWTTPVATNPSSVVKRIYRSDAAGGGGNTRELRCIETDESASTWGATTEYAVGLSTALDAGHSRAQVVSFDGDPWPDLLWVSPDGTMEGSGGQALDYWYTVADVYVGFMRGGAGGLEDAATSAEYALIEDQLTDSFLAGDYNYSGAIAAPDTEPGGYAFLDLDRNGTTDLVMGGGVYDVGTVFTLLADGSEQSSDLDLHTHPGRVLRMAQWADIDADGFIDLVLPANDVLDDDADLAALPGFVPLATHWIRNSGAPPYLSEDDLQALVIPFEDDAAGLLSSLFGESCDTDPDAQAAPPSHYYQETWQWRQTWAQWGDYNADGVADVAYGVHACWVDTGEELAVGETAYDATALYSHIFYGDGSGAFTDSGLGLNTGFDQVTLSATTSSAGTWTDPGCSGAVSSHPCTLDLLAWEIHANPTEGLATVDLDRSGQTNLVLSTEEEEGWVAFDGQSTAALEVYEDAGISLGFIATGEALPGHWLYHDVDGEGPVVPEGHQGARPMRERSGPPEGMKGQTRPTVANHARVSRALSEGNRDALPEDSDEGNRAASIALEPLVAAPGAENRFMGFRDATVSRENGSASTYRYIVQPWASGALAYQTDRGQDGALAAFHYTSFLHGDPDVGAAPVCEPVAPPPPPPGEPLPPAPPPPEGDGGPQLIGGAECIPGPAPGPLAITEASVDTVAPFFNAPRRRCDYQVGASSSADEYDLALDCDTEGGANLVDFADQFLLNGWSTDEDAETTTIGWTLTSPTLGLATAATSSDPGDWGPGAAGQAPNFPDLVSDPSSAISLPNEPERVDGGTPSWFEGGPAAIVEHWKTWSYTPGHELFITVDHRDASLAADEVTTTLSYGSWSWTTMGAPLTGRAETTADGSNTFAYAIATGTFDSPSMVTQSGSAGSRAWQYTYDLGDLASETDPDLVAATYVRNVCGLVATHTDAAARQEVVTYDGACRKLTRTWQGATTAWTYDGFGRVTEESTDPGLPASPVMTSWQVRDDATANIADDARPDLVTVYADDTVVESFLDDWGREVLSRTCSVSGAATEAEAGLPGGAALDDVRCDRSYAMPGLLTAIQVERGYAADGSVRFASAPFAVENGAASWVATEAAATTWSYADEFGRAEVRYSPAPTAYEDWVTTQTTYMPGAVSVEGPTRTCAVAYDTLDTEWSCEGTSRGSETRDAFGRTRTETDPAGVAWLTDYDGFGRPERRYLDGAGVSTASGTTFASTEWTWTDGDRPDTEEDEVGDRVAFGYDTAGRQTSVTYTPAAGLAVVTSTTMFGGTMGAVHVVSTTDINGNTTYTTLDGLDRVVGTVFPDASITASTYDERGRVASTTDARGGTTTFGYDFAGRLVSVTNPLGNESITDYDGAGRPVLSEDADGVIRELQYAYNGALLARYQGSATLEGFTYQADGLVSEHVVQGVATAFEYDTLGRRSGACVGAPISTCTSGGGQAYAWGYDSADRVNSFQRQTSTGSWRETELSTNDLGWTTSITHPDLTVEAMAYDRLGQLVLHTDEAGVETETSYDGWGRVDSESIPGVGYRTYSYAFDVTSAVPGGLNDGTIPEQHLLETVVTEPDGAATTNYSDWSGRVAQSWDDEGTLTASGFTGPDQTQVLRVSTALDALHWGYWYDAAGQMTARAGPMESTTWTSVSSSTTAPDPNAGGPYGFAYTYSGAGRLTTRTGANEEVTSWNWYDGELTSEEVGNLSLADDITRYDWFYDAYGRVESREWGGTRTTDWTRDVQGRITLEETADAAASMTTEYLQFSEYGAPKYVIRTVDGVIESTAQRTFDARGRVTRLQQEAGGYAFADVQYTRGDDGLVEQVLTPSGTLTYVRGADRRVYEVRQGGTALAVVTSRDLAGRNTGLWMQAGVGSATVTRAYDTMGRLSTQTTISGTGDVEGRAYTYDWQGRVESLDVNFNAVNTLAIDTDYTLEGWLDQESRQTPNGSGGWDTSVRAHAYDEAGNRLSTTVDGVLEHTWTYSAGNQLDTVDGTATGWNPQGEMTDDRGYAIDRNPDGSEAILSDGASSVAYDILRSPGGDPVATDDGATTRYQAWGNPEADLPLFYSEPSLFLTETVVAIEGAELGRLSGTGIFTPVATDALGSIVMDGSTFVDVPEAFGNGASANIVGMQRHVYAGLESLPGLPYQLPRARVMDPTVGRFTSVDPVGLDGGDHRFIYANNEPTGLVDPGGLKFAVGGFASPYNLAREQEVYASASDLSNLQAAFGRAMAGMTRWEPAPLHCLRTGSCISVKAGETEADPAKTRGERVADPNFPGWYTVVATSEPEPTAPSAPSSKSTTPVISERDVSAVLGTLDELAQRMTASDAPAAGGGQGTPVPGSGVEAGGGAGDLGALSRFRSPPGSGEALALGLAWSVMDGVDAAAGGAASFAWSLVPVSAIDFGAAGLAWHGDLIGAAKSSLQHHPAIGVANAIYNVPGQLSMVYEGYSGLQGRWRAGGGTVEGYHGFINDWGTRAAAGGQAVSTMGMVYQAGAMGMRGGAPRGTGQTIYRAMTDVGGRPAVGPSARALGVRPGAYPNDIPVGAGDLVHPGTGGMSVAPTPLDLPPFRRPPEFGGTGKDPVWALSTDDLGPKLRYVPDAPGHGTVQPIGSMTLEEFQQALCGTGPCWVRQ